MREVPQEVIIIQIIVSNFCERFKTLITLLKYICYKDQILLKTVWREREEIEKEIGGCSEPEGKPIKMTK